MSTRVRHVNILALTVFAVSALLAASPASAQTPVQGGTLNIGFPSDTKTLDPMFSVEFTERQVLYMVFNTLTKLGPDFSINPELALGWDVQDGGKRVVFELRQGVKFHDGTDFDAAAVKWNIDTRLDEAVKSPQRKQLVEVIDSVEVLDPATVVFNLKEPYPGLLGELAQRGGFMVSPSAWKKAGADFGGNPVGTGPFLFKEWVRGSQITLERNPNYWEKGLPHLDKVVFQDVSGSVVGVQRLQTGEIDYAGQLSPNDIRPLEASSDIEIYPITVGRWYSLQWHWDEPPYDNRDLRKAIAYALDRDKINGIAMAGKGTIANSPTPPGLWWHDASIEGYPRDLAKAKEHLAKSGYDTSKALVLVTPGSSVYQQINQLAQEQLAEIGLEVTLEPVAQKEWYSRVVKRVINFTPTRWTQRPDPDGLLYILFHSKGYANTTGYNNPEFDDLLDQARVITDVSARTRLYAEAQRILAEDLPNVPLFFSVEYGAMRKAVHGFEWIPDQIPRFRELWKVGS